MSAVLDRLRARGVRIALVEGEIVIELPIALNDSQLAFLRDHKAKLVTALRDERDGLSPIVLQMTRCNCVRCLGEGCRHCGWTGALTVRCATASSSDANRSQRSSIPPPTEPDGRLIVEYRRACWPARWITVLGVPGETLAGLAAGIRSMFADVLDVRERAP
jgi:hypothetical protein